MVLPPPKPRIWEDWLGNSLGKKRDTSEFDGSAYNQQSHVFPPSFRQLFNGILDILYIFVYFMYFMDFMNFLYFAYFVFYLYFRKKPNSPVKTCTFIKNRILNKTSYFPKFCWFWPTFFHKKIFATPQKTTHLGRSAQK